MSGAIMPAPLAMPAIVTSTPPISALAVATFGIGVGRHDRLGGLKDAVGLAPGDELIEDAVEFRGVERLADDAGRGQKISARTRAVALAASAAVNFAASRPVLPVKALALPELTTSARALPPCSLRPAPIDRRRGAFRLGEDARDLRALVEEGQHDVGAVLVADAGRAGRETHALDGRQIGKAHSARRARAQ